MLKLGKEKESPVFAWKAVHYLLRRLLVINLTCASNLNVQKYSREDFLHFSGGCPRPRYRGYVQACLLLCSQRSSSNVHHLTLKRSARRNLQPWDAKVAAHLNMCQSRAWRSYKWCSHSSTLPSFLCLVNKLTNYWCCSWWETPSRILSTMKTPWHCSQFHLLVSL